MLPEHLAVVSVSGSLVLEPGDRGKREAAPDWSGRYSEGKRRGVILS